MLRYFKALYGTITYSSFLKFNLNDDGFNKSLNSLVVKDSGFSVYEILPGHFLGHFLGHFSGHL